MRISGVDQEGIVRAISGKLVCVLMLALGQIVYGQSSARSDALALEAAGQVAEAEQAWQRIAASEPENAEAFAHLGLMEARQEHYTEATTYYQQALKLNPDLPGLRMNLGLAYFKASKFKQALEPFTAELRRHPGDPRLTVLLGMAHYGMGDYLVAIPYLQRGAEQQPESLPLRLALAHSCLWSKQYDCVLSTYKEILTLNPDSAEAEMLAAEALDETGDDAGAMTHFRAAAKANPKEANVHFGLGYLLWTQHHYAEAAKEFQQELLNDPQHTEADAYLGDADVQLNQFNDAKTELEKAAAGDAASSMVHRDLGIVYAAAGDKDNAAKQLQEAISLDPKDSTAHWRLGKLYQSSGRKEEAAAEFAKVSTMNASENRTLPQSMAGPPGAVHP